MSENLTPQPAEPVAPDSASEADSAPATPHPWSELEAEHLYLLRLTPLPADRDSGPRPLRFLQLGRVERHSRQISMLRLTVQVPGQHVSRPHNLLEVWANHARREVRFGPEEGLSVEPANRGLGRFLLAQGIAWINKRFSHYQVLGRPLPSRDNFNEAASNRRDHALKAQGFSIEHSDPLQLQAFIPDTLAAMLRSQWNSDKIQLIEPLEAAAMLQQADQNLFEQEIRVRKLEERIERLQRDDNGLRFTIGCLVVFCLFQAGLLIWIASR